MALTLEWQNKDEGWFQEYEGADPGYHTCTIDFLAKYMLKSRADALVAPLTKAVEFAWNFMHPDGSYGGEYGSRNTYHFYPHGFEVMARHTPKAGQIADAFLSAVGNGKRYINDDDRMTAHYVYNFLQAYDDYCPNRPRPIAEARTDQRTTWMPGAKMVVHRAAERSAGAGGAGYYAITNLSKGGCIKVFDNQGPIASDTGITGKLADGQVVVSHLVQTDASIKADPAKGRFEVETTLCKRRNNLPTPITNLIFRVLLLTIGRFNANLVRGLLQKILITGKPGTPYRVRRSIEFLSDRIVVEDRWPLETPFKRVAAGSDGTSIYVANSNVYQESVLCPWQEVDPSSLPVDGGMRVWRREYFRGSGHGPTQNDLATPGRGKPLD